MKYLPTSDADRSEMLASIGVSSVDQLFAAIPAAVRQDPNLPPRDRGSAAARWPREKERERAGERYPPTISFPLIVRGALMIRADRDGGKAGLDAFLHAMREIARETQEDPQIVLNAPHTTSVKRVDEVTAARNLILRWRPPSL